MTTCNHCIFNNMLALKITLLSSFFVGLVGCTSPIPAVPKAPTPPQTRWQTIDEVRGKDLSKPESEWVNQALSLKETPIGVLGFEGDERGRNSASQDVSRLLAKLSREGRITAVDREQIDKIRQEIESAQNEETTLKPAELAKLVGERVAVRYLLVGAVLQYDNQQTSVPLRKLFLDGEVSRYRKDYDAFIQELDNLEVVIKDKLSLEFINPTLVPSDARPKLQQIAVLRQQVWSPEKFMQDIDDRQRIEFASIATVGINARLIDVRTGQFAWFFEGEFQGASLNNTMDVASEILVEKMLSKTP